jgi:hypothetical protein
MAAKVAEKFKDPAKCQKVFNTCPFSSEEVMNMITKMNSNDDEESTSNNSNAFSYTVKKKPSGKPKKPEDGGLKNLKNTLLAIEKLNDVTVHAQFSGEPVDYDKIIQEATNSQVSSTSDQIVQDFEQFEGQIEAIQQAIDTADKKKQPKKVKSKDEVVRRHRRHGILPAPIGNDEFKGPPRTRVSRLSLVNTQVHPQKRFRVADASLEDAYEDSEEETAPFSTSVESKLQTRLNLKPLKPGNNNNRPNKEQSVGKRKVVKPADDDCEDDEVNSPEYEEIKVKVPSFSQTFQETLQTPPRNKNKPRPVHPIVKVKEQYIQRATTRRPTTDSTPSTTSPPAYRRRSTKPPVLAPLTKFTVELEDDEEEAIKNEQTIDFVVSKYKPKEKRPSSSSSSSLISS